MTAESGVDGPDPTEDRTDRLALAREQARDLLAALGALTPDDPARPALRDRLVELHLPLVEHLARRFRNRGEPLDDLVQVATIGLIKSIDRFDIERGVEFSTYATPTIVGEIKRHFRDRGWAVRVPRRLQELRVTLTSARAELSQKLGRAPTVAELAEYLALTEEEVLEGLESANAYSTLSLDATEQSDDEGPAVVDQLGAEDEALDGRRIPRVTQASSGTAFTPREAHSDAALLREHDAVADRLRDRDLADARLPAARADAGEIAG